MFDWVLNTPLDSVIKSFRKVSFLCSKGTADSLESPLLSSTPCPFLVTLLPLLLLSLVSLVAFRISFLPVRLVELLDFPFHSSFALCLITSSFLFQKSKVAFFRDRAIFSSQILLVIFPRPS